jgi:hypothetical protein
MRVWESYGEGGWGVGGLSISYGLSRWVDYFLVRLSTAIRNIGIRWSNYARLDLLLQRLLLQGSNSLTSI